MEDPLLEGVLSDCATSFGVLPENDGRGGVTMDVGGDLASPDVRSSDRKKSLRSTTARGRLAKSRPKSPLLRMAEMRRRGLRGRDLCLSGRMEGSGVKGKKRAGERRLQGKLPLPSIPEASVELGSLVEMSGVDAGDVVVLGGSGEMPREESGVDGGLGGEGVEMMVVSGSKVQGDLLLLGNLECRSVEESFVQKDLIPAGDSGDLALDLIETQPLQEMSFIGEQVMQKTVGKDWPILEPQQREDLGCAKRVNDVEQGSGAEEEFMALTADNL